MRKLRINRPRLPEQSGERAAAQRLLATRLTGVLHDNKFKRRGASSFHSHLIKQHFRGRCLSALSTSVALLSTKRGKKRRQRGRYSRNTRSHSALGRRVHLRGDNGNCLRIRKGNAKATRRIRHVVGFALNICRLAKDEH